MTEKPIAYHFGYKYHSPFGCEDDVLRYDAGPWNGQHPHAVVAFYTEAQLDAYTAELRAEVERLRAEALELRREVERLANDAARYRWLRDDDGLVVLPYDDYGIGPMYPSGSELDAAIDKAMEATNGS